MGKQVGKYIQQLRESRGVGLRQLGDQIGLSASHLSMVEHGQREVSIVILYGITAALDGDFISALRLLAVDAGVPEEAIIDDSLEIE